jgi:tRNA wybutosine-synthesizing protein 4
MIVILILHNIINDIRLISEDHENLEIFEVDFEEVVDKKALVCLSESIKAVLTSNITSNVTSSSPSEGKDSSISSSRNCSPSAKARALPYKVNGGYKIGKLNLLSVDLRNADNLLAILIDAGLKLDVPTLVLTECVLVYIEKTDADKLCSSLGSALQDATWVTYDMINPYDAFGKVMANNLRSAGYKVPGFTEFYDLNLQMKRFLDYESWDTATSTKMLDVYEKLLSKEDKQRIAKLEIFDEIEEWGLLMSHYCLTIASKGQKLSVLHSLLK